MFSYRGITRFIFSFPIQLVVLLIKKNHILLLYWVVLFYFVSGSLAQRFGIPYLFLDPEYLGHVSISAFFIMGFAVGSFIMVFNISSYIINGFRFPFLATLAKPFMKYCLNNSIIPAAFALVYLYRFISFQVYYEYQGISLLLLDGLAFIVGMTIIVFATIAYFSRTNHDIRIFGLKASDADPENPYAQHLLEEGLEERPSILAALRARTWRVDTYLSHLFSVKLVRRTEHYPQEVVDKVFRQNHQNAAVIEIIVFVLFILLGLFKDYPAFQLPAGACIILIFSLFIMLSSAFRFWLRSWSAAAFIFIFLLLNFFSQYAFFYPENKVYGIHYNQKVSYNVPRITELTTDSIVDHDIKQQTDVLEKWKNQLVSNPGEKPKLILVNCSGGGLRASMWTFRVMQVADSLTGNQFFKNVRLVSGASGGMIGAAYYREESLKNHTAEPSAVFNTGKDLLNPVAFSITVSDLFFNFQKFKDGNTRYSKDRAYAFEKQLSFNLNNAFDKRLIDYRGIEGQALAPMLVFSPTIINDGRRLIVSPLPVSYLTYTQTEPGEAPEITDAIEYGRFFKEQEADSIRFTSVLRMSATFPYILPAVSLPTSPTIHVMDAGIRDNSGLKISLRYLYVFRNWIEQNTSGVIVVNIRSDIQRMKMMEAKPRPSILENIVTPLGNIYGNLLTIQDYTNDEALYYAQSWFKGPVEFINFELPTRDQEISLSWHLTSREKNSIYNTISNNTNQEAFLRLIEALGLNRQIAGNQYQRF